MTKPLSLAQGAKLSIIMILALVMAGCAYLGGDGQEDAKFVAVEEGGAKVWKGGGTVDLKGRSAMTLKVVNTLGVDHGFSIDTMKVQEVIKANEERTITVPAGNIDTSVREHRVYCQLHPKHGAASLTVTK